MSKITIEVNENVLIKKWLPDIIVAFVSTEMLRNVMIQRLAHEKTTSFCIYESDYERGSMFDGKTLTLFYFTNKRSVKSPKKATLSNLCKVIDVKAKDLETFDRIIRELIEFQKSIFDAMC